MQAGSTVLDVRMISDIMAGDVIGICVYIWEKIVYSQLSKRMYQTLEDISCETLEYVSDSI
jgi:hypothetical protein